jgi:hypothetical protein
VCLSFFSVFLFVFLKVRLYTLLSFQIRSLIYKLKYISVLNYMKLLSGIRQNSEVVSDKNLTFREDTDRNVCDPFLHDMPGYMLISRVYY